MSLLRYWMFIELGIVIVVLSIVVVNLRRKAKENKERQPLPTSLLGKGVYFFKYILKIIGAGLGTFLLLFFILMVERSAVTVYTETAPAPSKVGVPADLSFAVEDVKFESGDGLTIAGWYVPNHNGATVILLHGYGGNRKGMLWHAEKLVNAGYGVLMYDERASGESEGTYRSYGWEDTRDVKAAIQFLLERDDAGEHIGIAGCSTGASIAVYSAALFPEIEAAWGDGNSSVRAQDLPAPKNPLMAAIIAGNYTLDWMYTIKLGIEAPAPLTEVIDQIAPRPVMLVGGGKGHPAFGSEADLYTLRYARIAGDNARAWIIPEATHCNGPAVRPDEYAKRLVEFFDASLLQ